MKKIKIDLKTVIIFSLSLLLYSLGTQQIASASQPSTKYALGNYVAKNFRLINNKNYYVARPKTYTTSSTYRSQGTFQTNPDTYQNVKGNFALIKTALYLPVTVHHSGDWCDPQSLVITPDGKTAYIAYLKTSGSTVGWIVKYNLNKINSTLGGYSTKMDALRRASNAYSKNKATNSDQNLLKFIKEGPTFNIGHCQSLALNPKTHQLWFSKTNGKAGHYGSAVQVSQTTLKPITTVNYRLVNKHGIKLAVNSNLTFDNKGYAYFSSYSGKSALKVYRGTITSKGVHFKLIMQGLAHRPGQTHQSIAFNTNNGRLYFVSDDSISSVPIKKLIQKKAKTKDVQASVFASGREFEGLSFSKDGQGYMITNRGAELLTIDFGK